MEIVRDSDWSLKRGEGHSFYFGTCSCAVCCGDIELSKFGTLQRRLLVLKEDLVGSDREDSTVLIPAGTHWVHPWCLKDLRRGGLVRGRFVN